MAIDLAKLADYRKARGFSQSAFWTRFGVNQSGGSRYEAGRNISSSVAALVWLVDSGIVTENELTDAFKATKRR